MLRNWDELRGYTIRATDGSLGSVHDLLFDDREWTTRWLVVDTAWLFGRRVLIGREALGSPHMGAREMPVALTKDRIKDAPASDADKPVSRQHEADLYGYYGWAPYWGAGVYAPVVPPPVATAPIVTPPPGEAGRDSAGDPHLRSAREVTGYYIKGSDDSVGHVEDFLIEDSSWVIRYLVVDTRNWLPGRKVLIAPNWVGRISWADGEVTLQLTRRQIEDSPEYAPEMTVDRGYEQRLYRHYGTLEYWT